MQGSRNGSVLLRMAERRLVCEREITIQQERIDSLLTFSRTRCDSTKSEAQRTIQLQENLGKLKGELRQAEDALVKALSVKTRKEAKRMEMMESISAMKARVEELKGLVEDQGGRKDQYATIISQQFEALTAYKEKFSENRQHREQIEEAISWYNKVLGFRIECGHGVKFIFTNINRDNPKEEYSFTIRHEKDIYTLVNCDPPLSDTKKMVDELNKTNGLFKFARVMREKFQESAASGTAILCLSGMSQHRSSLDQDPSEISLSAPASPVSTDHSLQTPCDEKGRPQVIESHVKSRNVGKEHMNHSSRSSSFRRSTRLKGNK